MESDGRVPAPPSEWSRWLLAAAVALLGAGTLAAVLSGAVGAGRLPPPLPARAATPVAARSEIDPATGRRVFAAQTRPGTRDAIVSEPPADSRARTVRGGASGFQGLLSMPVPATWIEGFYPIYEEAQRTFGVNWLLIASIHAQESAFSTAPGIYRGLNFARCCGGPMQFNVTNGGAGTSSTWALVKDSYRDALRPSHYDHMTVHHPSIYDDFDSIMAAAHLLSLDGASHPLDDSAWWAAYDYYGHDSYGVLYADRVLARAIGWSQHGFCTGCGVSGSLVAAVQAAYGAPVDAQLEAESAAASSAASARHHHSVRARAARR